jgi:LuxR family transcriptional regulator, maltose regulon positive regulatory protein
MVTASSISILVRPRLLEALRPDILPRIILINAPPGYGKTTFAHQLADFIGYPAIWQQLDVWQQDIPNLHLRSVHAWSIILPHIKAALPPTKNARQSAFQIATYLLENLSSPHVYILDDTHNIANNENTSQWLRTFVDTAPQNLCIVLVGRSVPDIRWSNLVAKGQVLAYGTDELRFTSQEIIDLTDVPVKQAQSLEKKLDGWIAGIRLAFGKNTKTLTHLLGDGKPEEVLFNALAEETFIQLPIDLRDCLLTISTLENITPTSCELVGIKDFSPYLAQLLERNLFLNKNPSEDGYVFHILFRAFLQQKSRQTQPEIFYELHRQVATHYEQIDKVELAIWHFASSDKVEEAIRLAEMIAKEFFIFGKWESLLTFRELLDGYDIPLVNLYSGTLCIERNEFTSATKYLQKAKEGFTKQGDNVRLLSVHLQTAYCFQRQGLYEKALELAKLVAEDTNSTFRAWGCRLQGSIYIDMGRLEDALAPLQVALAEFRLKNLTHETSHVLQDLSSVYLRSGKFYEAESILNEMVALRQKFDNPNDLALAMNSLGFYYHCCSQYSDAQDTLQKGLQIIEDSQSRAAGYLYWSLGDLLRDMGRFAIAESKYETALKIAEQSDETLYLGVLLSIARLRVWQNRLADALKWVQLALDEAKPETLLYCVAQATQAVIQLLVKPQNAQPNTLIKLLDELVERHAYLKVAQLLGSYWLAAIRSQSKDLEQYVQQVLLGIGVHLYQPIAAELVNMQSLTEIDGHRNSFSELFRLIDILSANHENLVPTSVKITSHNIKMFTLGQEQVVYNNSPIPDSAWQFALARELFFYLYFEGKQRKEDIALTFWSDHSPQQIRHIFHNTIHRARKGVEDGISYLDGYYMVNPQFIIECDAYRFRDYVNRARHLPSQSVRAEDLYTRAIDLNKGMFLPSVFSDWATQHRSKLHDLYIEALIGLAQCQEARNDFPAAIENYEKAFLLAPDLEELACAMMECYTKMGKPTEVQNVYYRLENYLRDELMTSPSTDTKNLLRQLLK